MRRRLLLLGVIGCSYGDAVPKSDIQVYRVAGHIASVRYEGNDSCGAKWPATLSKFLESSDEVTVTSAAMQVTPVMPKRMPLSPRRIPFVQGRQTVTDFGVTGDYPGSGWRVALLDEQSTGTPTGLMVLRTEPHGSFICADAAFIGVAPGRTPQL